MTLGALLDVLVPPRCAACGAAARDPLCAGCRREIPWLRGPRCLRCALPLFAHRSCPARGQAFEAAWAPVAYDGVARELVAALKFRHGRPLAAVLAAHIAAGVPPQLAAGAAIVPVPAHPAHARRRGYDQAELLAQVAASALGRPAAAILERTRATTAQFDLDRAERAGNVAGAFALRGGRPASPRPLAGRWIVLVDDVVTTGATLSSCARPLLDAGALAVSAVTIARER
jgi:ComF family protein